MSAVTAKRQPIHIGRHSPAGQVVVHSGDDAFLLTVQEAVKACGAWDRMAEFQIQMKRLMDRLGEWVEVHRPTVRDAYLSVQAGGGLFFLAVMRSKKYDGSLEDELTRLDVEVAGAEEYGLLRLSVLAIPDSPADCVDSFLAGS